MAAEVVKYFFPKFVDLHNYIPANSTPQKFSNWSLLNRQEICFYYLFIRYIIIICYISACMDLCYPTAGKDHLVNMFTSPQNILMNTLSQ